MHMQRDPSAKWAGILMLIRPDVTKMSEGAQPRCRVVSARRLELDGKRSIVTELEYAQVAHLFKSEDGDAIEVYAELSGEHLQIHERAQKEDFFLLPEYHSSSPRALSA